MRYAIVVNGIVTNVVIWDGVTQWAHEGEAVAIADMPIGIGWNYDGSVFTEPDEP